VAIPLGTFFDQGYRRTVLCLNVCGLTLMYLWFVLVGHFDEVFPIKAMLVGPLLSFIGGSEATIMSVAAAIVTDIAPNEARRYVVCISPTLHPNSHYDRSSFFAYVGSLAYISSMLGPAISAFTMTFNIWLPFWMGISMLLLAIPTICLLEGAKSSLSGVAINPETAPLLPQDSSVIKPPSYENYFQLRSAKLLSFYSKIWSRVKSRPNFKLLLAVFLTASLASSNTPILPQYLSKRFYITFAQAGVLLSVKALANVVLLVLAVPTAISFMLTKRRMPGERINFYGAKLTLVISIAGAALVALSFKLWILIACIFPFQLRF
jgi:hypothetical protein